MNPGIEKDLREQRDQLAPAQQRQVLDFARALAARKVSGNALTRFAGAVAKEDLSLMAAAIDAGCEQGNPDEW